MNAALDSHAQLEQEEAEQKALAQQLQAQFAAAAAECQADKFATFAERKRDHRTGYPRFQTIGELMFRAIDCTDFEERAMQVLLNAAAGRGTQREAQQLLEEIGAAWADGAAL